MSKPEWQKNVELLEEKQKQLEAIKTKLSSKKTLLFRGRRELRIAALDGEINEIKKMVAALKAKKRGTKITRGGIQGIVLDVNKLREVRLDTKKKRKDSEKAKYEAAKNSATGHEQKYWEKKENRVKKKSDKLKNKIVRAQGIQRTIQWPKYRKLHLRELSDSRAAARHNVRDQRHKDIMTRASTYSSLGTVSGSLKAATYMVKGALYKKRMGVTEKVSEALRHTVVKLFGARKKKIKKKGRRRTP